MSRAIVFDCDGVLVDSEPHSAAAWVAVLGRRGHRATAADVADCTGLGFAATYDHLAGVDPGVVLPPAEDLWPEVQAALAASFDRGLEGVTAKQAEAELVKIERLMETYQKNRKLHGPMFDDVLKLKYLHQRYTNFLKYMEWRDKQGSAGGR